MKHSIASESSAAWTMYQKYANGLPLYRQEKDWLQYGIELSRSQLANWIIYCARNYFKPVYDHLHKELLKRQFLMADETTVQVLKEPDRTPQNKSYMWLFRSGEDGLPTIILYGYTPTRGGYNAGEFLEGFCGYLETDGYQGYNKVSGIKGAAVGHICAGTLLKQCPKAKSMITAIQLCRVFHSAMNYLNMRTSIKNRVSHTKNEVQCVWNRKSLYWMLFGRGLINSIL